MFGELADFMTAGGICESNGGSLAQMDNCHVLGEVAKYIEDNGEYEAAKFFQTRV